MVTPRRRPPSTNGEKVSLRDYFDRIIDHQTDLLTERAQSHGQEHQIHEEAHKREHLEAKQAIQVATDALDKRLDTLQAQIHTDLAGLTSQIKTLDADRISARGYILGVGAIIALVVLVANFAVPLFFR